MRSVAILCWGFMIFVKNWLERVSKFSIGSSSVGVVSGILADLMFLLICFMSTFYGAMEGVRCFIRSTVRLGHVDKGNFLMAWGKIL